ncbi:amino acid permease [Rhodohalobacter mucosus]|uniref:Universal stress protein n=1 Tax=Rhodohalobacter mucosus TaxID=2079485 RepID=A0A316TRN8_9BACT|nr:amino acid permease [Rhodohalobacter mucosus]PWN07283.1 universal stress protein [Rhodohalobacter mucosus]
MSELKRELGFWDALTIGAGTMIGAGIFLLAGVALEMSGPAAIFAYILSGIVCMITASSAAELATGMPTSGGDYYFVSRSLGPALGAISGVGIWLSLTFAIAFYLYGMGEYLSQFLPVTAFWGAFIGGVLLTVLNVIGAKESGRTQVVVVLTLLVILSSFSFLGVFNIDTNNFSPFFPFGTSPIMGTTALVFVSFLGFVKIAAVAEEIKEPSKNLPRALIGSVALVTILYVVILLVIGGMFTQDTIGSVRDPLTAAARTMLGNPGVVVLIFAGLLATVSSANASILASSRINLAMARDRMVPNWLSKIHETRLTPYRAIIFTGILALTFLLLDSLEDLAKVASVLQLYSYAALNIGCVILRASNPDWYKPTYRSPGTPGLQILAALGCLGIIIYSGTFAQIAVVVLITGSLIWYAAWGRSKVEFEHSLPELKKNWEQSGLKIFTQPIERHEAEVTEEWTPGVRELNAKEPRHILTALANPKTEGVLLRVSKFIATGETEGGKVTGLSIVKVPYQTPLSTIRKKLSERDKVEGKIRETFKKYERKEPDAASGKEEILDKTTFEAVSEAAYNVFNGLIYETEQRKADMILMGWKGEFNIGRIHKSPVQKIISDTKADVGVFKDRGFEKIDSILLPWGGGYHAQLGLEIGLRISRNMNSTLTLLRLVKEGTDLEDEEERLRKFVLTLTDSPDRVRIKVRVAPDITNGILEEYNEESYDLTIIGASHEWSIRQVLFGTVTDIVADSAPSSVLMVRRYVTEDWKQKASEGLKRMKEQLGLSSSPDSLN